MSNSDLNTSSESNPELEGALSENVLIMLCFHDEAAAVAVNCIDPDLFGSEPYKVIARAAIDYFISYKKTCKEHISDLLEHKLKDQNEKKASLYKNIILDLYNNRDSINTEYVLKELTKFIRTQKIKASLVTAVRSIKNGDIDSAELVLSKALKSQIDVFDPGVHLLDLKRSLAFLHEEEVFYPTGIKALDNLGIGPAPGELLVVLAPANRGKTWMMIHMGKMLSVLGLRVLHISLEMSEEKVSQRYIQSFFSIAKRSKDIAVPRFDTNDSGLLLGMRLDLVQRPTLKDPKIEDLITEKLKGRHCAPWIKRFPTNALTVKGLEAYLDAMELHYKFSPHVIIVDYADIMYLDHNHIRESTGQIYKDLRRIAVERNLAVVTASQANRLAEDARVITLKHLAEDYSKAATADNIIAYCQTSAELRFKLARLFVAKARNEEREQTVAISQAYPIGQFCMDSVLMVDRYWSDIGTLAGDSNEESSDNRTSRSTSSQEDNSTPTQNEKKTPSGIKRRSITS